MSKRQLRSAIQIRGEAANSNRRASELRRLAASRNVMAILKKHIWVAEDLETYLEDMGYSVDENGYVADVKYEGEAVYPTEVVKPAYAPAPVPAYKPAY